MKERIPFEELQTSKEQVVEEVGRAIKTFERELSESQRKDLFSRVFVPRLLAVQKFSASDRAIAKYEIGKLFDQSSAKDALRELCENDDDLTEFHEQISAMEALAQKDWTKFTKDILGVSVESGDDNFLYSEDFLEEANDFASDPSVRKKKKKSKTRHPGRQPLGKTVSGNNPEVLRRKARQFRQLQDSWTLPQEGVLSVSELPKREIPPAFHEILLRDEDGLKELDIQDILGQTMRASDSRSTELDVIETRMKNIFAKTSTRKLCFEVFTMVHDFLVQHKDELYARNEVTRHEYREQFPLDDLVDELLRKYVRALVDWYPHVYNQTLDVPMPDSGSTSLHRERLRMYLRDGLKKSLNVVVREFSRESGLGLQLDLAIQQKIDHHYYNKPSGPEDLLAA